MDGQSEGHMDNTRMSFFKQVAGTFYGGVCEDVCHVHAHLQHSITTDSTPSGNSWHILVLSGKCVYFKEVSNKNCSYLHLERLPLSYPLSHFSTTQIFLKSCI